MRCGSSSLTHARSGNALIAEVRAHDEETDKVKNIQNGWQRWGQKDRGKAAATTFETQVTSSADSASIPEVCPSLISEKGIHHSHIRARVKLCPSLPDNYVARYAELASPLLQTEVLGQRTSAVPGGSSLLL